MIDEDLYQQAADELNSDRRRSALWARACALASDDHDEARFLYTNLRVEELLAENRTVKSTASPFEEDEAEAEADATLALEPLDATVVESKPVGFLDEFEPSETTADAPRSFSAPAGMDNGNASEDILSLDQPISEEPDPDATLMEDYVPEMRSDFDDTFEGTSVVSDDDVAVALEEVARENQDPIGDSSDNHESTANAVKESSTNDGFTTAGLAEAIANAKSESDDYAAVYNQEDDSADLTQVSDMTHANELTQSNDLTQANVQVFDEHIDELDDMLANVQQSTEDTGSVEDVAEDMSWLDNDDVTQRPPTPKTAAVMDHEEDPVVYEDSTFANELNRQADELGFHAPDSELASMKQDLEDQARVFEEPDSSYINKKPVLDEFLSEEPEAHVQDSLESESDKSISVVGTGATAAVAAVAAVAASGIASAPDLSEPVTKEYGKTDDSSRPVSHTELELPLDLTSGRKGREYEIYRQDVKAQAVKSGVSWSALFLTFPYLVYRHLFGTALVYATLWIISLGGLAIAGLAWIDSGTAVTPLIQACTIGFALIAFVGLIYLPFRYGNQWRAEKLENRGYELVAITKAPSPGKAIARARRHSALLN